MKNERFSKKALIERYQRWREQIEKGDLKVYVDGNGYVTIEWPNTSIFRPSFADLEDVIYTEYSDAEREESRISAGITSLIVTTSVKHQV